MIFYRRRKSLTTDRMPGELPPTKILWRNTAIAWGAFTWGMVFAYSLSEWYGDHSLPSSLATSRPLAIILLLSEFLLFATIAICIICGAFFGAVLLLTSVIATLHRSWQIDDSISTRDMPSSEQS